MGLGFSFGAKDTGLDSMLSGITSQFKQLEDAVQSVQASAAEGFSPAENLITDIQGQLSDLQKEAGGGTTLADVLDLGGAGDKAKEEVGGLTSAVGGMAAETALGGTKFGRMANSVLGGAGKITGALGWVGMALGPIISGFGQAAEAAGGMVEAVTGLPRRAGDAIHRIANEGVNLTNSLEAEALGLSTTARAVGVNMGYVGQELNRFVGQSTSMAMSLNIGADEAARAIRAWDESAETLGATGLNSAQDVARFTAALGVNADMLRNSTLEMQNLGASEDQIHLITSAIAQMGQETGDLSGALNELPQIMQILERRRALGDSPEQMVAFATDTAAAARGLFAFTQDSERARSMAAELAGTVTDSREAFQNMFAGAEDQLPQLVTELSITSGEVEESFRLMQGGPGGLIEGMGQLVQSTRESGGDVGQLMEFMRGRLQQVFGNDMTATLINFWGTMDSETVAAMGSIRNASVDLGDLAQQAHRTGRTMDEVLERMRGAFQVTIRSFARSDSREFLQNTRESLRDLSAAAREAHRAQGPVSDFMSLISRSGQLGALALMPAELRGSAVAADELRGQIMPLINAFSSWGGVLDTVLGYVSIFTTDVISSWGQITRASRRAGGETVDSMDALGQAIDQQANRYADIFEKWLGDSEDFILQFVDSFASLDWGGIFGPEEGEGSAAGAFGRIIRRIGDIDWGRIWKQLQEGFENLFNAVRPWLTQKVNELKSLIGQAVSQWWDQINWSEVFSGLGGFGAGLWEAMQPALTALGTLIGGWFSENWPTVARYAMLGISAAFLLLVNVILIAVVALVAAPIILIGELIGQGIVALGEWLVSYFEGIGGAVSQVWDDVYEFFKAGWDDAIRWFQQRGWSMASWFGNLWDGMSQNVAQAVQDWMGIFDGIIEFFGGIGTSIRGTIGGAISWISEQWDAFAGSLAGVWDGMSAGWDTLLDRGEAFWTALTALPARIQEGWQGMVSFFRTMFASIRAVVGEDLGQVGELFQTVADAGSRAFAFITQRAEEEHGHSVHTIVGRDMEQVVEVMTNMANQVADVMQEVLHDATVEAIVTGFSQGFTSVIDNMGDFSDGMVDAFTDMAEGISDIMTELFVSVLTQAEVTMLGTETAVESIIARLRTITAAQARLAEERSSAVSGLARPADEEAMRRRMAQLEGNDVLRAIHHPDWYGGVAGSGGYQRLFVAKMNELREAVAALAVNPAAGTVEQRRRAVQEAASGVRRSGVGGHNGLPSGPGR